MNCAENETSGSTNGSVVIRKQKKKKEKRKERKHKKTKRKHKSSDSDSENGKKHHKKRKKTKSKRNAKEREGKVPEVAEGIPGPSVPPDLPLANSKSRAPMTKEEWEKSQSVIRRVYDETGRSRLIKGDGEILEEIVSRDRHREINRQATFGDGLYFQNKLHEKK